MKRSSWFQSIQARMIFILLFATTIIFAGFMLTYYRTTRDEMTMDLNEIGIFLADNLAISLAEPLWDMNSTAIGGIIDAAMKEKQVYAVLIKENNAVSYGKIRNEQWNTIKATKSVYSDNYIIKKRKVVNKNETLGEVEIWLTPEFMQKKLNRAIGNMLTTLLMLNAFLFLLLFFSIRKTIISPIRTAAACLSRISAGDIPDKIADEYNGEFNEIRNNLNLLIDATLITTRIAEEIAGGSITVEVRERSTQDRMMKALNRMIQKLNEIMNETKGMIQAVGQGRLDIRGRSEAFEGVWQELVEGINDLISGLSHAVSTAASVSMEMELAKRIQSVLLPKKTEIKGYEIVASCEPADEVGGDYYDVISVAGYDWIVVGDVSGHGVTSGLVMMMVQTAIHTVLLENPSTPPSKLLSAVNRVIYENIKRMDEAKHMTIVVFAGGSNGYFTFAGLHEKILIWRAQSGAVESVETDGMWIGLEPDIAEMLSTDTLCLEKGDCMVLYTDGVIEACREGAMFGERRLANLVEKSGCKSAHELHGDIMKSLAGWEKSDDVTFMVVKRVECTQSRNKL